MKKVTFPLLSGGDLKAKTESETKAEYQTLQTKYFFFHRHYSPLWALACRTMSFHFFLSATNSLSIFSLPALEDLFLLPLSIFSWVFPFISSLRVLEWRSFWASYPPPFSLGDLTSLSLGHQSMQYKSQSFPLCNIFYCHFFVSFRSKYFPVHLQSLEMLYLPPPPSE